MPLLANYCRKNSSRSKRDNGAEQVCCCDQNKSGSNPASPCSPNCSEESKSKCKYDGIGIVKTFLGPSLEDAVIKTLEFGKSLIQNPDENDSVSNEISVQKRTKKSCKERCKTHTEKCLGHGVKAHLCDAKNHSDCRQGRKRIVFTTQLEDNLPLVRKPPRKLSQLSKIRSLDSDLKTTPPSPEKIKKQLEALIQINKDEPPEHANKWNIFAKMPPVPMEMTVMPSVCIYKNQVDLNSSSCEGQSRGKSSCDQSSSNRCERRARNRLGAPSGICQAPEFISNALGPTLDVSIIDNLKMMRDIFKTGESGRGEGGTVCTGGSKRSSCVSFIDSSTSKQGSCRQRSSTPPPCSKTSRSQESMTSKIQEAEKIIQELTQKQCFLQKQIEQEEQERALRRKVFEEEERKMGEMKACLHNLAKHTRECSTQKSQSDINYDCKYEAIRQRVACEEEKLSRLKDQYECYRRELFIARSRCDAIRRNKCILDAWDVIASRICHTRLPSFTRAYTLERKELKVSESSGNTHCCFPASYPVTEGSTETPRSSCPKKFKSQCHCGKDSGACSSRSKESLGTENVSNAKACIIAQGEIPFPIQRDITCGLHQTLKTCSCKSMAKGDAVPCNSDDQLLKKCGGATRKCKPACHSKSDTTMRREKNSKIVKVLWAITRINIFQDNCRTYEVMDATTTPPPCIPAKTEGIFVVRNTQKKGCPDSGTRKKCTINFSKK